MKSVSMSGWLAKVRRGDGTPFDVRRIEAAAACTGHEVGYDDPDMPAAPARTSGDFWPWPAASSVT
jgi:ribonucleoside-diphosphate reductase alpha chain